MNPRDAVFLVILFAACSLGGMIIGFEKGKAIGQPAPVSEVSPPTTDYKVKLLFIKDGCAVYQFRDPDASYPLKHFVKCANTPTLIEESK